MSQQYAITQKTIDAIATQSPELQALGPKEFAMLMGMFLYSQLPLRYKPEDQVEFAMDIANVILVHFQEAQ